MTADDPESTLDWWAEEDADGNAKTSPWEALALAFEIADAVRSGCPETFLSTIPVRLDATCSGIQHLAAFMWDETAMPLRSTTEEIMGWHLDTRVRIYIGLCMALERLSKSLPESDNGVKQN